MAKAKKQSLYWLWALIGGVVIGMFFAPKKGSVLRQELSEKGEQEGALGQLALLKDEYSAMLQEIGNVIEETLESPEVKQALVKITVLTKELLPRRENETD